MAVNDADEEVRQLADLLDGPFDPLLKDVSRLRLQTALHALPEGAALSFTALRRLLGLTDGNLGMHLKVLTDAGFVETDEQWSGRRRTTMYRASHHGRDALEGHLRALQAVIDAAASRPP